MAKTSTKKYSATAVNPRSRAAKRATSPSIDVDKSVKEVPRALGTSPMLGVSRGSGVTKKKKTKQVTRGQRARQEKGLARAEAVMDQMEKKVDGAKARLKKRHQRKGLWDDVNDTTLDEQRKTAKAPGRDMIVNENQEQDGDWEDEVLPEGDIDMSPTSANHTSNAGAISHQDATPRTEMPPPLPPSRDHELDLIT